MISLAPEELFSKLVQDLPSEYLRHLIVVGSLAAAFHFREQIAGRAVKTKDADLLLHPRSEAAQSGQEMAKQLRRLGWHPNLDSRQPQQTPTPTDKLPLIRMYPPNSKEYFIEFLTLPESEKETGKHWISVQLEDGWYGICSFEFMSLNAYKPFCSQMGVSYARPSMMALANLLSHPKIQLERMSSAYEDRIIKRSNKDLGRVLSLAWLSGEDVDDWLGEWKEGLNSCFSTRWTTLAAQAATGLRDLLRNDADLEEAWYTCDIGLLNGKNITPESLRVTGKRLLIDALEPLEMSATLAP